MTCARPFRLLCLLFAGCVNPWEGYDASVYAWYVTTDPQAQREHTELLREVIAVESWDGQRPPPTVRLALAYHELRLERPLEARAALDDEARDYPHECRDLVRALTALWELTDVSAGAR